MRTFKFTASFAAIFTAIFAHVAVAVILLLSATSQMNAQTEQGRWLAGGGIGGNLSVESNPIQLLGQSFAQNQTSFLFGLSPQAGYFVAPDLAIGLGVGFLVSRRATADAYVFNTFGFSSSFTGGRGTIVNTSWSLNIGPFARYFFLRLAPTTKLFAQVQLNTGFINSASTQEAENFNYRATSTGILLQPVLTIGCAFFVSPNVAVEPTISYKRSFSWAGNSNASSISTTFTRELTPISRSTGLLQYGIGFQIYF